MPFPPGYRNGFSKLIPDKEIQRFAENYVSTTVLARQPRLNGSALLRHLKESGTPLLAILVPDAGKGRTFFLPKEVAAQIQLPTRRMLREAAQRRIVAGRKKQWAEYRRAREAAG